MSSRKSPIFLLLLALTLPMESPAHPAALSASFNNPTAAKGLCLAPSRQPASAYLKKYGIRVRNGTKGEGKAVIPAAGSDSALANSLALLIQRVESLGGKSFPPMRSLSAWSVPDLDITARQTEQGLVFRSAHVGNVALIAHELGHQVGNSNNWYGRYRGAVPNACRFSDYSQANHGFGSRNEEFAEAFSVFLTNPRLLLDGSATCQGACKVACQKAYGFFSRQMFGGAESNCRGADEGGGDVMLASAHVHTETCNEEPARRNHANLAETSRHLEAAAHTQEAVDYERSAVSRSGSGGGGGGGGGSGESAFGSTINMNMIGGMAVQFMPVITAYYQAKSQQTAIQNMYSVPNLLESTGLSTTTTTTTVAPPTVSPIDIDQIVPVVDPSPSSETGTISPSSLDSTGR